MTPHPQARDPLVRLAHEPAPGLDRLVGLLGDLVECLEFDDVRDRAEFVLSSTGGVAVSAYLGRRLSTAQARKLLSSVELAPGAQEVLWTLLARVPCEAHMVRLGDRGHFGLGFKTDFPTLLLVPLLDSLGLAEAGTPVSSYFSARGRPACGASFETQPNGSWRVRFYDMARDAGEVHDTLEQLGRHAPGPKRREEIESLVSMLLAPGLEAVLNLAAATESGFSIKVEVPNVDLVGLPSEIALREADWAAYQSAATLARIIGRSRFCYFGWRVDSADRRELTFYLDAGNAVSGAGPSLA